MVGDEWMVTKELKLESGKKVPRGQIAHVVKRDGDLVEVEFNTPGNSSFREELDLFGEEWKNFTPWHLWRCVVPDEAGVDETGIDQSLVFRISAITQKVCPRFYTKVQPPAKIEIEIETDTNQIKHLITALKVSAVLVVISMFYAFSNCLRKNKTKNLASKIPGEDDVEFPATWRTPTLKGGICVNLIARNNIYVVAFANAGSGDQRGRAFVEHLNAILGRSGRAFELPHELDKGFDEIVEIKKNENVQVRILACGGDGTVTWVLSEIQSRAAECFPNDDAPPVGIIPLGTGNDLARSLGWGAALTELTELETYVLRVLYAKPVLLDQWKLRLRPKNSLPPALRPTKDLDVDFVGYFTNYFSVGMDAMTAYEVGRTRKGRLGKCCFRTRCIKPCKFVHGGLLCYIYNAPDIFRCWCCKTRALNNRDFQVRLQPRAEPPGVQRDNKFTTTNANESGLESEVYSSDRDFRQFTFTNLNSYGAGMELYNSKEMESVSPSDGQLEAFTLEGPLSVAAVAVTKKIAKTSCGSVPLVRRVRRAEMTLEEGQYFQMDGEPWRLNAGCRAVVEFHTKVKMLCPPVDGQGAGDWSGKQQRSFWEKTSMQGQCLEMGMLGSS